MMRFQLLQSLILVNFTMLAAFATSQNDPPIAKPGCLDRCGKTLIPYPFGTTEGCYLHERFRVTCNTTFNNHSATLFLGDSNIDIIEIFPSGQMRLMQYISQSCYNATDGNTTSNTTNLSLGEFFTVNNTANKFTVVGCDSFGSISGLHSKDNRPYSTGCIAMCELESDLEDGRCNGLGCCQTEIPYNVRLLNVTVGSFNNYNDTRNITNCTFGFLVETSTFKFHKINLTNLKKVEEVPIVVDWDIGEVTNCTEAQKVPSDYACKSANSTCYKPENGYGYRCQCKDGYHGNPYIIDGCQDINECQDKRCEHKCVNTQGSFYCTCYKGYHGDGKINGTGCIPNPDESLDLKLATGISTGLILLLIIVYLTYIEYKRRHLKKIKKEWFKQNGGEKLQIELNRMGASKDMFTNYSSSQLSKATNNFHKSNIIGQGEFGKVYKGVLSNKTMVAIKEYKIIDPNSNQDQVEQFVKEVIVLLRINNENIVKLLGYCFEREIPLLVHEFSNATLFTHLYDPTKAYRLTWEKRLKIATEIAGVLLDLRSTRPNPIICRDVKLDNILFKDNYTVKVADFGKSRRISLDENKKSIDVQEIKGYLDPEYFKTGQLTTKSDVYSFGVVLLELLTGRKAFRPDAPVEQRSLVAYSQSMMKQNRFEQLIDGNIASQDDTELVNNVAQLAELCVKMNEDERPDMQDIAVWLQSVMCGSKQSFQTKQNTSENTQPPAVEGFNGITPIDYGGSTSA